MLPSFFAYNEGFERWLMTVVAANAVWPVKNRQMSIKVAQKILAPLQRRFGQINNYQRLWKVAQSPQFSETV